jgi:hypothetical protein
MESKYSGLPDRDERDVSTLNTPQQASLHVSNLGTSSSQKSASARPKRGGRVGSKTMHGASGGLSAPAHDDNNILIDRFIEQLSSYSTMDTPNPLQNNDNVSFSQTYTNIKREFGHALPSSHITDQLQNMQNRFHGRGEIGQ